MSAANGKTAVREQAALIDDDAPADEFPVDTFRDAARHLRRPFSAKAVKFKVQATWPKDSPRSGLVVAYIDARLAVERLNLVCPHLWSDASEEFGKGLLRCSLTVDGITRSDVGEGYVGKGLWSDALKRAAVRFGVGVSLYAIPKIVLSKDDGHLKDQRTSKGMSLALTDSGEKRCRELYQAWLDSHGKEAFGQPLEHGDVEDAVGDYDASTAAPEPDSRPAVARQQEANGGDRPRQPNSHRFTDAEHEEQIAELIGSDQELRHLREYVNEGMKLAGAGARQRHQYLRDAKSKAALEDLRKRVDAAQETTADESAPDA